MLVALTGTPGTGKSAVAIVLRQRGLEVIDLGALARQTGLLVSKDETRDSYEIDPEVLRVVVEPLRRRDLLLLEGHLSHLVSPDRTIVLRCHPRVLADRLRSRGWSAVKVQENVEAEAIDTILVEAVESGAPVFEIDTTTLQAEQTATAVQEILAGKTEKYLPGHVDWSEEVLSWY